MKTIFVIKFDEKHFFDQNGKFFCPNKKMFINIFFFNFNMLISIMKIVVVSVCTFSLHYSVQILLCDAVFVVHSCKIPSGKPVVLSGNRGSEKVKRIK
jgi:hypothetical protein